MRQFTYEAIGDADVAAIARFVQNGGSAIVAGPVKDSPYEEYVKQPVNKIMAKMGALFGKRNWRNFKENFTFAETPPDNVNFAVALDGLAALDDAQTVGYNIQYFINKNTENEAEFGPLYEKYGNLGLTSMLAKYDQLANNEASFKAKPNVYSEGFQNLYPFFMQEVQ